MILSFDEENAYDFILWKCKKELKRSLVLGKFVLEIDLGSIAAGKAIIHVSAVDLAYLYAILAHSYVLVTIVILIRKRVHERMGESSSIKTCRFFSTILSC